MNYYEKLREKLDTHPSGAPKSEVFREILEILFTSEEVIVASHMSFMTKTAIQIAEAASMPVEETEKLLESMANKVVINSREKDGVMHYSLLPTVPGIFEISLMKSESSPMHKKLAKLWDDYNEGSMIESLCGDPTPHMRVVPVEQSLDSKNHIYTYEEVVHLVKSSNFISVGNCACRTSADNCDAPREVCFFFGSIGKALADKGLAKSLEKEEAILILTSAEEAGLVHMSNNSMDKANIICNCCPCCCHTMRGLVELKNTNAFAVSSFVAEVNIEECTNCGICYNDRCPVGAINENEDVYVDTEKCIGCGLCVTGCPTDSIVLKNRENYIEPPENAQEMVMKMLEEKGKMKKFMELNMK